MKLTANNINKKIKGRSILSNVSLELDGGKIYGFTGRNGSGKTMLFRALSGLMKIDSGEIKCDGMQLHKDIPILPSLGIVLENAGLGVNEVRDIILYEKERGALILLASHNKEDITLLTDQVLQIEKGCLKKAV